MGYQMIDVLNSYHEPINQTGPYIFRVFKSKRLVKWTSMVIVVLVCDKPNIQM
jgi:hypothetical protein